MRRMTIALAKGRLAENAAAVFRKAGYDCSVLEENSRKLVLENDSSMLRFIMAKPSDVPTYVESGVADIGVAGKDSILEMNPSVYEVLDLGFGRCSLCVCGPKDLDFQEIGHGKLRVASKYPNIARRYFAETKREAVEIIKLNGSVELAPLVGLSDVIVDIVESGRTLKENNLAVLETIVECSARLLVNQVSMKLKSQEINELLSRLRQFQSENR